MSDPMNIVNPDAIFGAKDDLPALPRPRGGQEIVIRLATLSDYGFIDALQKANSKAVGFMWEKAIQGHIQKGNVLVAEAATGAEGPNDKAAGSVDLDAHSAPGPLDPLAPTAAPQPVGYVIGVDRYLKRDELGVIYQMNVVPEYRRSLVAANLLKAKFERSAYGCRLYCCWCAQDLAANRFWEAMGFVPLAFRTGGGRNKKTGPRMHIFWQKRIRQGDTGDPSSGGTPYWFPSQTGAGAIGEDRIVLPIPPGTHWSDAKPIVLPNGPAPGNQGNVNGEVKLLENEVQRLERERKDKVKQKKAEAAKRAAKASATQQTVKRGGLRFGPAGDGPQDQAAQQQAEAEVEAELKEAKKAVKRARKKFDPAQEAFARELKDRWLEQVAAEPSLLLPAEGCERYDVRRRIEGPATPAAAQVSSRQIVESRAVRSVAGELIPEARRLEKPGQDVREAA